MGIVCSELEYFCRKFPINCSTYILTFAVVEFSQSLMQAIGFYSVCQVSLASVLAISVLHSRCSVSLKIFWMQLFLIY